jgi:hypothetical protein
MLIRCETAADVSAIRSTIGVAFALPEQPNALPPEAALVDTASVLALGPLGSPPRESAKRCGSSAYARNTGCRRVLIRLALRFGWSQHLTKKRALDVALFGQRWLSLFLRRLQPASVFFDEID